MTEPKGSPGAESPPAGGAATGADTTPFGHHGQLDPAATSQAPTIADGSAIRLGETVDARPRQVHPVGAITPPDRYQLGKHLAGGGQGDVYRVYDRQLRRDMVMKILGEWWCDDPVAIARFVQEAQITAQLQHPSVVPVHEIGALADGRPYYTMAEIRGRTLASVIEAVHAASSAGWSPEPAGVSFRRLIDYFHRVCECVGFAHVRGVVHRDLKPHNVMLGPFGEVLVLDWGLARIGKQIDAAVRGPSTTRGDDDALMSQAGSIAGTAGYMSPEQAAGEVELGPPTDVYALGMILREILTGTPPSLPERMGVLAPIVATAERPLPDELIAIAERATRHALAERYPDGGELARAVEAFLDGARKRERARELLAQAEAVGPRIAELEREAGELTRQARAILDGLPPSAPAEAKQPGWELADAAAGKRLDAELATVEMNRLIDLSLIEAELPEAHAMLARHYRALHVAAEARHDPNARTIEQQLRAHDRGEHAAYLAGMGALTLVTEPPAQVELRRYELRGRRLVDEHVRDLGVTPLRALALPRGSYLLILRAPGHHEVRYPVAIGRQEHWDPVRPGDATTTPVVLPRLGEVDDDEVFVAGGPFWCGGDPQAAGEVMPRQRVWVDSFILRRDPVTNRELLAMANALIADGTPAAEALALSIVPRHRGSTVGEAGTLIWPRNDAGAFTLATDDEGITWQPEMPTCMVTWHGAVAVAEWHAQHTGRRYRLPGELEFEKAARGVDGRAFPWGDHFDPTWANMRLSCDDGLRPRDVALFPVDASPYLARSLAGNVCEWCGDDYRREGPPLLDGRYAPPRDGSAAPPTNRTLRSGCFLFDAFLLRAATRHDSMSIMRDISVGFRLARSLDDRGR
ncbi:MAG: SUMF1/EgtB/PvdO family nonheme iron enzyme [Kofleriaceae bacterium]|nr:SUMF1/EgtB/PvdO family nonheme iron enzyme [Kofleriaceae bacterium]